MSACALAALARIAKLIASRTSSSLAPAALAPARSRFAQWVLPAARFAARYHREAVLASSAPFLYYHDAITFSSTKNLLLASLPLPFQGEGRGEGRLNAGRL